MKNSALPWLWLCLLLLQQPAFAQTIGTAKAPEDLLKSTLLLETAESKTSTKYVPFGIFKQEGEKTIQISPTNLVVAVEQPETVFHAAGSGVLVAGALFSHVQRGSNQPRLGKNTGGFRVKLRAHQNCLNLTNLGGP